MINVIVPIVENVANWQDFIKRHNSDDVQFFVGIREDLKQEFSLKSKNVHLKVFKSESKKEEIINSLHSSKLQEGKILVVRRALTDEEFLNLTTSKCDISHLTTQRGRFVTAFKNFVRMLIMRFFAFSFFDDISAICYGENMFQLMSVCANLSMASRVNKYVGVEIEQYVTTNKSVKKDYCRWKNILMIVLWSLLLAGSIVGGTLICVYVSTYMLVVLGVVLWIVVALGLWLMAMINFLRNVAVGNLRYGRAEECV